MFTVRKWYISYNAGAQQAERREEAPGFRTPCSSVSIVNFEEVNADLVGFVEVEFETS